MTQHQLTKAMKIIILIFFSYIGNIYSFASDVVLVYENISHLEQAIKSFETIEQFDVLRKSYDYLIINSCKLDDAKQNYEKIRRDIIDSLVKIYVHVDGLIDKDFRVYDMPSINISPSAEYPSGIDPDFIEDEALKKQYIVDIKKNRQAMRKYNRNYALAELKHEIKNDILSVANCMYSKVENKNNKELLKILSSHDVSFVEFFSNESD